MSFILALLLCYIFYAGLDYAGSVFPDSGIGNILVQLGINTHYTSLSRGVIDTRDVVYFLSLSAFFILLTRFTLERRKW